MPKRQALLPVTLRRLRVPLQLSAPARERLGAALGCEIPERLEQTEISLTAWRHIEKCYREKIPGHVRDSLELASIKYLQSADFEKNAEPWAMVGPKIVETRETTHRLVREARKLLILLEGPSDLIITDEATGRRETAPTDQRGHFPSQHDENRDANALIGHAIRQNFNLLSGDRLACFVRELESLIVALSNVEPSKITGHQQAGLAWNAWINELSAIIKNAPPLPFQVRKDHSSSNIDSQFVCLVAALQNQFPREWRRCQVDGPDDHQLLTNTNMKKLADAIHSAREKTRTTSDKVTAKRAAGPTVD